jgi:hypothetical protein
MILKDLTDILVPEKLQNAWLLLVSKEMIHESIKEQKITETKSPNAK